MSDAAAAAPRRTLSLVDRVALVVATVAGAGASPVAPGTAGSLVAVAILWLVPFSRGGLGLFLAVVIVAGTWAAQRAEPLLGRKDPGAIVIDEVAGMTVAVLAAPRTLPVLAVAFVLFRIFDVVKPFPANVSQRLAGGVGVMADDLIAGLYALACVAALRGLGWLP
ncbi:MAG: phosphatidylglycerophosphatase A [Candidatus Rokubacteria bacterium]|nr:phosphatidylglycerophosphatase A [Candidatus Rokubacteria bacterium]